MKNVIPKLKKMLPLFVIQFFTWLALFSLWIYATPVVTKYFFNTTEADTPAFEKGVRWVGICFAFYSLLAAILAFFIPKLLRYITKFRLHAYALFAGSIGLMSMAFLSSPYALLLSFLFIGIAWSSIGNIPYLVVGELAKEEEMSLYFSIFNFSVVIPQITAAFLLSWLTGHFFNGETRLTIFAGGFSMLIASILTFIISTTKQTN